ncbi:MAG: hypothetical protein RIS70_329 [Planctomycetota bacterium]|jgi:hypothetical protein
MDSEPVRRFAVPFVAVVSALTRRILVDENRHLHPMSYIFNERSSRGVPHRHVMFVMDRRTMEVSTGANAAMGVSNRVGESYQQGSHDRRIPAEDRPVAAGMPRHSLHRPGLGPVFG